MELKIKQMKLTKQQKHLQQLDQVVQDHFSTLYTGAIRMGVNVEADHWAPERIEMRNPNETRLHARQGIKAVNGVKVVDGNREPDNSDTLTDEDIKVLTKQLQNLFDAAADEGSTRITIEVKNVK